MKPEGVLSDIITSARTARVMPASRTRRLLLLDLTLPDADGSGLDLLDELKARCPVVIFSVRMPEPDITGQVVAELTTSMNSNEQIPGTITNTLRGDRS